MLEMEGVGAGFYLGGTVLAIRRYDLELAASGATEGDYALARVWLDGEYGCRLGRWLGRCYDDGIDNACHHAGPEKGIEDGIGADRIVKIEVDIGVVFNLGANGVKAFGANSEADETGGRCLTRAGRIGQVDATGLPTEHGLAFAR